MNVKSQVKIKAKLLGNEVIMTLPVAVDVETAIKTQAIAQAEHMNLTDVKILNLEKTNQEQWVQLEIPFDNSNQSSNQAQESNQNVAAGYTPYGMQQPSEASVASSNDETYTPYASVESTEDATETLNPCYVPMVNDSYVPYNTRIVPIDSSYRNYHF